MIKGIIFDFDGVIVDSEKAYIDMLVEYISSHGKKTCFDEVKTTVGQNVNDIADEMIMRYRLPVNREQFIAETSALFEKYFDLDRMEEMEGLSDFLERCRKKGVRMSVASSSNRQYLLDVLDKLRLSDYFDFVMSGEGLVHSKPDPEIYDQAAQRMKTDKKDLIIIEDSVNGIRAAKAAGIFVYGFKGSVIEMDTSEADEEIRSFSQIDI